MSSQAERGTAREMVHTIAFRAGVLERILQEPVLGDLEIRADELAHVQLLQRQIDDLRRYLNLPSANPERKWIPVIEALPKEKETVLITNNKGHVRCGQYQGTFDDKNYRWWWKHNTLETVVAWMPLPEPWRGEE